MHIESEPLISTLATDSIIGAMVSPNTPGSGYVLLHHVMGITEGHRGIWAYVEGGNGENFIKRHPSNGTSSIRYGCRFQSYRRVRQGQRR